MKKSIERFKVIDGKVVFSPDLTRSLVKRLPECLLSEDEVKDNKIRDKNEREVINKLIKKNSRELILQDKESLFWILSNQKRIAYCGASLEHGKPVTRLFNLYIQGDENVPKSLNEFLISNYPIPIELDKNSLPAIEVKISGYLRLDTKLAQVLEKEDFPGIVKGRKQINIDNCLSRADKLALPPPAQGILIRSEAKKMEYLRRMRMSRRLRSEDPEDNIEETLKNIDEYDRNIQNGYFPEGITACREEDRELIEYLSSVSKSQRIEAIIKQDKEQKKLEAVCKRIVDRCHEIYLKGSSSESKNEQQ